MKVGYARTSTADQVAGFEAQIAELKEYGVTQLFKEQVSSVGERIAFIRAMDYVRAGDTLIVTKLDRLARSVADTIAIVDELDKKGVGLVILNMQLDTSTPTGRLVIQVLASIAEFERNIMLERQREGIAKAKREGRMTGRPKKDYDGAQFDELAAFAEDELNSITVTAVCKVFGISRSTYYRRLKERRQLWINQQNQQHPN